ncbi:hypothetical protein BK131_22265 [Paenibacillus amylolyticus]|uniref:Uncharacterized protein n=1 Tax=Paenibacillus amylolyticus TaxID=1451 RepID=A0A1R1BN11_PAEAM|nr:MULTISPECIES: hypothetical protein [Paenibacillus]MBD8839652.1 hypothetical protein [Paenibacillus sp. CFBP 13594]OMF11158.1 hypothetical protein BK131_22265 [Paenibacillus amylolyticus]
MFEPLKDNWLSILIFLLSPVGVTSLILLLSSNKHERILFTPKKNLYRLITKIVTLSAIGTLLATLITSFLTYLLNNNIFEFSTLYFIIVFITYFIFMSSILSFTERKHKTYHWIYLEKYQYEPLLILKITFNNKLLVSSIPTIGDKFNQGYIILEDISILENQEIFFIGPKNINWFKTNQPGFNDLLIAVNKFKPRS